MREKNIQEMFHAEDRIFFILENEVLLLTECSKSSYIEP